MAKFEYLPVDIQEELRATANAIVAPGKGILAADESTSKLGASIELDPLCGSKHGDDNSRVLARTT